jgi:hypothetical protein
MGCLTKINESLRAEGWIGLTEAARLMGCHWSTLYRFTQSGKFDSQKAGGYRYVRVSQCAEYAGPTVAKKLGWITEPEPPPERG